jgi:hypothetical protein
MTDRPDFLKKRHENGATIVAEFRALPKQDAAAVDAWLLYAAVYGSMTWQERHLYQWINEAEEQE